MDQLGFRVDLPEFALPSLTWASLGRVPVVVVTLGIVLAGVYRLRGRKASHG